MRMRSVKFPRGEGDGWLWNDLFRADLQDGREDSVPCNSFLGQERARLSVFCKKTAQKNSNLSPSLTKKPGACSGCKLNRG